MTKISELTECHACEVDNYVLCNTCKMYYDIHSNSELCNTCYECFDNIDDEEDKSRELQYYYDNIEYCKARNKEYKRTHEIDVKDKRRQFMTNHREYQASWGGRIDSTNNSLLKIDTNLFQ